MLAHEGSISLVKHGSLAWRFLVHTLHAASVRLGSPEHSLSHLQLGCREREDVLLVHTA
jgi:hypothetical protein